MGQYSKKGLYSAYDKNNIERQKEDYYSTPTEEVVNILNTIGLKFTENDLILEPSCGGGHMVEGILQYNKVPRIIATDIKVRENKFLGNHINSGVDYYCGDDYDYLKDDYPVAAAEYVIMNPPFKLIEPFVMRSLEIATKGVLMFGRLQFLEGKGRYENIFKENPPTDIYVYVDRVACFKNGDLSIKPDSIQAYAWFYWDKENISKRREFNWIRRAAK